MDNEQIERAVWLQRDAAFLYGEASKKRDSKAPASNWVAMLIQDNAANSARLARQALGLDA